MAVQVTVNGAGLLNYAKTGPEAVKRIRAALSKILNKGRTTARQAIVSEFGPAFCVGKREGYKRARRSRPPRSKARWRLFHGS